LLGPDLSSSRKIVIAIIVAVVALTAVISLLMVRKVGCSCCKKGKGQVLLADRN
jgi:hypothetical protein